VQSSAHVRTVSSAEEKVQMPMAATKIWTIEDLDALPDDGNTHEVLFGELFVTPAPGSSHEEIAARLISKIVPYVESNGIGRVYTPRSVVQHGGSQVEPDLTVRQPLKMGAPWNEQPIPSLVIEILPPSNRAAYRAAKRKFYPESGVDEYWIVGPPQRMITSVRTGLPDIEMHDVATWNPRGANEPLVIDLAWLCDPGQAAFAEC
jgi:Uma2 family endonuclease